jgi:hypothetical protein
MRSNSIVAATGLGMLHITIAVLVVMGAAAPAFAQDRPLPPFEIDARVFTTRIGQDETTATDLGLSPGDLASSAKGFAFAANTYPLRGASTALGIGVETIFGRGVTTIASTTGGQPFSVQTYISGFAGELSLNFGHRAGWSYISAGAGPMRINTFAGRAPLAEPPGKLTPNFGGGARWFNYTHLAVGFDVRFYLTQGNDTSALFPGRGKRRILVISGGFSIK